MPVIGTPRRYDLKFLFRVEIDAVGSADFKSCSEPTITVGMAELWQGGSMISIKEPTRLTFADITLERGMSRDLDLWVWLKETADAASSTGLPSPTMMRHFARVQYDRAGVPVERLEFYFGFCKEYSPGDSDNDSDDFAMERVVIAYSFYERYPLSPF